MLRALADGVAGGGWEQCTGAFVQLRPGTLNLNSCRL